MQRLSDISTIRAVMEKNGFSFSKALGQNFLINPSVCPRMAEMSGAADCAGAIEVGPGIGVLTYELSQVSKKVVTIELDKRLLPVLDETLADCDNVKVINDDVMKIDLHRVIEEEFNGEEVAVCANLPYYITSPVIMKLLEDRLPITSITVMVQRINEFNIIVGFHDILHRLEDSFQFLTTIFRPLDSQIGRAHV